MQECVWKNQWNRKNQLKNKDIKWKEVSLEAQKRKIEIGQMQLKFKTLISVVIIEILTIARQIRMYFLI